MAYDFGSLALELLSVPPQESFLASRQPMDPAKLEGLGEEERTRRRRAHAGSKVWDVLRENVW